MPGRDGTGPLGQGSMTGRGLGLCGGARAGVRSGAGLRSGIRQNISVNGASKESLLAEKERLERGIKDIDAQINALD